MYTAHMRLISNYYCTDDKSLAFPSVRVLKCLCDMSILNTAVYFLEKLQS